MLGLILQVPSNGLTIGCVEIYWPNYHKLTHWVNAWLNGSLLVLQWSFLLGELCLNTQCGE
jgi:hypothetical protein